MKYGAMNFPIRPVMEEVNKIAGLGFDYIELTLDPPCAHYSDIERIEKQLARTLNNHGMEVVCHLPSFVYTADLAPGIRRASLNEMLHSLEAAARINVRKAVLHPSITSGLGPLIPDQAAEFADQSLDLILKKAGEMGISICLENMFPAYHSYFIPDHFQDLFKRYPELKLTLDTGHANIGDPEGTRLFDFIKHFSHRIGHIHVSDNKGMHDEHLAVGKGSINFEKFAERIMVSGYDDTITLEIFSQNPEDLVKSRKKITALLG